MGYREKSFTKRISYGPEPAEVMFERWADDHGVTWHRLGLDRPPFKYVPQVPSVLRAAPDYLAEGSASPFDGTTVAGKPLRHVLVECKGCGRDQTLKVKDDSLRDITRWQEWAERPVMFFLYDMANQRVAPMVPLVEVQARCAEAEQGRFPDNNRLYYKLTTDMFEWRAVPPDDGEPEA